MPPKKRRNYTLEEVATHNTAKSLWVIMNRKVYDVTMFHKRHPGGAAVLLQMGGKDATAAATAAHKTILPGNLMWEFCIGSVVRQKKLEVPQAPGPPAVAVAGGSTNSLAVPADGSGSVAYGSGKPASDLYPSGTASYLYDSQPSKETTSHSVEETYSKPASPLGSSELAPPQAVVTRRGSTGSRKEVGSRANLGVPKASSAGPPVTRQTSGRGKASSSARPAVTASAKADAASSVRPRPEAAGDELRPKSSGEEVRPAQRAAPISGVPQRSLPKPGKDDVAQPKEKDKHTEGTAKITDEVGQSPTDSFGSRSVQGSCDSGPCLITEFSNSPRRDPGSVIIHAAEFLMESLRADHRLKRWSDLSEQSVLSRQVQRFLAAASIAWPAASSSEDATSVRQELRQRVHGAGHEVADTLLDVMRRPFPLGEDVLVEAVRIMCEECLGDSRLVRFFAAVAGGGSSPSTRAVVERHHSGGKTAPKPVPVDAVDPGQQAREQACSLEPGDDRSGGEASEVSSRCQPKSPGLCSLPGQCSAPGPALASTQILGGKVLKC